MLGRINAHRASSGLGALTACGTLRSAAIAHSNDQAAHNNMTHSGSDGSTMVTRAERAGYSGWMALGENVAYGYGSVESVMAGWMSSPGHRANILNAGYTHVGLGRATATNGTLYWTQDFGRSGRC
ncbi:MAG: CAP domain-containing protein [Microthrixaceae bacterium]|nr:CAP domain-containing protein [Microthrixaceae bacterium]